MRRVDAEGDSRGIRDRKQGGSQVKSRLRKATIEWLERRELLATAGASLSNLPAPVVVTPPNLMAAVSTGDNLTANASAISPSVAVDPVDPQKMVAVWTYIDTATPLNVGALNTISRYIEGAFSTDGGVTWTPLTGSDSADAQIDFSQSQANGPIVFTQNTDAHVAFDRSENFYILSSTHNDAGSVGVLDLQRFSFTGNGAPTQTMTNNRLYAWDATDSGGADTAQNPVLAVDSNLASFTDVNANGQTVTQTDPFAGDVYLAWASTDTNTSPGIGNFDPNSIRMISSSDQGLTFTAPAYVNDDANANNGGSHSGFSRNVEPAIAISQGNPTTGVPGGQVTVVYDDYNTIPATTGQPYDQILAQTNLVGGSAQTVAGPTNTPINVAPTNPAGGSIPTATNISIPVNITDPNFTTLGALDVNLAISYPDMNTLSATLTSPTGTQILLFNNAVNDLGTTIVPAQGIGGANLGVTTSGQVVGTTFDPAAIRTIRDGNSKSPYVGNYQPEDGGENALVGLEGMTAAELDGTWTLQIISYVNETGFTAPAPSIRSVSLQFSSGNNPGFNPTTGMPVPSVTVVDNMSAMETVSPSINAASTPTYVVTPDNTTGVKGSGNTLTPATPATAPILPTPSIASDNTLGAYSPYEGRIYVAYTGSDGVPANGQTDIYLVASDDGGASWFAINPADYPGPATSTGIQVNDDNAASDGFSSAGFNGTAANPETGRSKFDPTVAVDQYTGAVVVSFYDTRNDASNARVATYVAVSNDGGETFAPETYANPTNYATDAITGNTLVSLGPIPDNESSGNHNTDIAGFGNQMGLAVADGMIIPVWASNQNTGAVGFTGLSIVDSVMSDAGGPRVISSTMGPVGQPGDTVNTDRATDGSPVANSLILTFDRPINPATLNPDGLASSGQPIGTGDVRVYYQDPYGATVTGVSTSHATVANGTYVSTSPVVSGQAGVPIVDGQLTLSLAGFSNLGAVNITLVAPNGRSFNVPTSVGQKSLNGTYSLPANVVGGAVDGTYQLRITDTAGQVGTLKSWSIQLNGLSIGLRVLTIAPVPNLSDPLNDGTYGYTTFRVTFDPTNPTNGVATGVGTYSYVVRPNLNDEMRYVGVGGTITGSTVFENAQLPQLPIPGLPLTGTTATNSSLYLTGHPGAPIGAGTLSISLTDTTVQDLTIKLIAPGGQTFTLPKSTGTVLNQTYTLPNSFLGTAVDGHYQLSIVSNTGTDVGQLTNWSLEITPEGPFVTSPNVPVTLNATGTVTSTLAVNAIPASEVITSGAITLAVEPDFNNPALTIADLTITLTGPGGQTFVIPTAGNFNTSLIETIQLPAAFLTKLLSGTYTLSITDGTAGDVGTLTSWSIALSPAAFNGNAMDQNADGVPGQDPETTPFHGLTPGDDYAVPTPQPLPSAPVTFSGSALPPGPYTNSTLPLIVSGPHITLTNVTGTGGSTTGTSTNNLVANDQVGSVGAVFDSNVQISSVNSTQVLSILGPAGPIASPQTFASTGVSKTFTAPSTQIGTIPRGAGTSLDSTLTISNTGLTLSSLTVNLNITDPLDSSLTLTLISPNGTKVPLAVNVGGPNGANFSDTTFSDAPPPNGLTIPIGSAAATAPFGLTYQPAMPLAALAGQVIDGNWQLVIQDNLPANSALALGYLHSWSLAITPQIPQGPSTSLTSSLTVSNPDDSFTIGHLGLQLNITAPNDSNISAVLIAPNGEQVYLFNNLPDNVTGGGANANFTNTTFDDSSTVNIVNGVAPYLQTYVPIYDGLTPPPAGFVTLSSLKGLALNGTWQLRLVDTSLPGTEGHATLNSWSLIATPQITVKASQTYTSTDTTPTTYVSTDNSTQIYSSADVSYAKTLTIPAIIGSTISSQIAFPSTGDTFNIASLSIALSITYPRDTNLSAALISPSGLTIPLFAGVGGTGANFSNGNPDYTIFSDTGTVAIAAGAAPFDSGDLENYPNDVTTVYRPASPLSVLDGTAIDGTWTLKVTNNSGQFAGKFNGWAMIVTPQPVPATTTAPILPVGATQPVEPIPIVPAAGTSGPLVSSITFPVTNGTYILAGLATTLSLTAPAGGNLADLTGVLIAPNGIQATLFTAGDGTFTGAGTTVTKTLTPLNAISGQNQFVNIALDGQWQLVITDAKTTDAIDALNGWSLTTTPQPLAMSQPNEPVPITTAPNPGTTTPPTSLATSITIPDSVPIKGLRLQLTLSSPDNSSITATLTGPNGVTITLFTGANLSASGANFSKVMFDDNATTSIDAGTAPYSGTFKPEGTLATFNGITAAGVWTLTITDSAPNATGPVAVLDGWSLINTPPASATLANTYQINFPTQMLSGTYALTVGAGILGADPSINNPSALANPTLGTAANPNLNAGVDVLKGTSATGIIATTTTVYNAVSVPVAIPKPPSAAGTSTLVSQIVVPDNFLIQGVTSTGLPGVTVTLNITFANDPDLAAVLIAPDGTMIPLFTHVGLGTNKANFTGTILEDTVNPPSPIDSGGAPFFGTYNPETPLSDLKGHNSGGVWSLEITNSLRAGESTLFAGTLTSWALTFQKPLPDSGLGDPVADRQTVDFQIFNIAPTNPLTNDTWTAVGPAGVTTTLGQTGTFAGAVGSVAVDPSDPTGNTVYVASASGGIWKTTDFLTSNPAGPTYLPLTDFGPTFSLNVGSIAVFGRNSDPNQSVLFAGTGFADATATYNSGESPSYPNIGGNAGRGVGILRSFDGGATWTLLDSLVNVDSSGNPLPENSPLRDHAFVGDTTYKVVVDPTLSPNGQVIIYAALGGPTGGLYQSLDSGNTWKLLSTTYSNGGPATPFNNAAATDVILDPNSKSPTTGNIDIVYAAFSGIGVFISSNQGQTLTLMNGQLGKDPLITGPGFPAQPIAVQDAGVTPNGIAGSRIILAKPALTGNAAEDLLYQDWLYAAVENSNGTFNALYVTKDRGENWTKVNLGTLPTPANVTTTTATPTNNQSAQSYDPTANAPGITDQNQIGNYAFAMTIDPSNPNIVYLGGSQNFQQTGLIRIDLTDLYDPHNFVSFANNRNDGGTLTLNSTGGVGVMNPTTVFTNGAYYPPTAAPGPTPYLNLRHAPNTGTAGTSPFNVNATLVATGVNGAGFTNDGSGVTWTFMDEPLKANLDDATGSTNLHDMITYLDPVTGNVRLVFADDQGVFTALLNSNGTMDDGIGNDVAANYSRNGNLQDEQFYYGAAQPSNVAAQAAGALFYASGQGILAAQSDPSLLSNGNLTWSDVAVLDPVNGDASRQTTANTAITTSDRAGVGIATDQTGGTTASGPTGTGPSFYEFDVPSLGGNLTDFFRVNGIGQTTGLAGAVNQEFPFGNTPASGTSGNDLAGAIANGQIPLGNFAVNPLNGSQILIGSAEGRLYETTTKGVQWLPIGQPSNFDGTQLSAIVYGAPDPSAPDGVGNLNNFIYVGTVGGLNTTPMDVGHGGNIFVTNDGGKDWMNISSGLDGSSVSAIYTNPNRGSHQAYAVTLNGVFYSSDTLGLAAAGKTVWTNITNNLSQIQYSPFGQAILGQAVLATFQSNSGSANQGTAQYGGFSSIVADYRYTIPDPTGATDASGNVLRYPVLYVSGYGGVFRSLDNGASWTVFPNTAFDAAPVDGGYLPSVDVTNLEINLGDVNPTTGHATQSPGDPEVLLATTGGRGVFAIGLAPDVFPSYTKLDPSTDSGAANNLPDVTNDPTPIIDGVSEISNFGNTVTITLTDASNGDVLGVGTTDALGNFSIQIVNNGTDPSFFKSSTKVDDKVVGIQATDSAGAKGNISTFAYTLDTIKPATPSKPILDPAPVVVGGVNYYYDSGRSNTDNNTNLSIPSQPGPNGSLTIVAPVFNVATTIPPLNVLTPNPIGLTVELIRSTSPTFPVGPNTVIVATAPGGVSSPNMLTDSSLATLANVPGGITQTFYYEAIQTDQAGNVSAPPYGVLTVYVNTTPPKAPTSLTLTSIVNNTQPAFSVTGLLTGGTPVVSDQLYLYRSISTVNGGAPVLAGIGNIGATTVFDGENLSPVPPPNPDGVYTYQVAQQDVYGNFSLLSTGSSGIVVVTINTQVPPSTPFLDKTPVVVGGVNYFYDSGRSQTDNITNFAIPLPTPGATPNFKGPLFDVPTVPPPANQPATKTVELLSSTSPSGPFTVVGTSPYNPAGVTLVTDTTLSLAINLNQIYYYEAEQVDAAGIVSKPSNPVAVHVYTVVPNTLLAPTLDTTTTGLVPNITNNTHPLFDLGNMNGVPDMLGTALGTNDQLLLYRSTNGTQPVLVGIAPLGTVQVFDGEGIAGNPGVPKDGVYSYYLAQEDLAGNVSNLSPTTLVTINTTTPPMPTLTLLQADDSGLPLHPNVTNVQEPRVLGTAPFNSPVNFPVVILNITNLTDGTGLPVSVTTFPGANGTYEVQTSTAGTEFPTGFPDGTYTLVARTENLAGTFSYSTPLTITIKHTGPQVTPSLVILPADDTGIKGDGVTANHRPRFTGITDPGDTVTLYSLVNGVVTSTGVTTTSSTVNGSFTLQLPFNLTDGSTVLYAQTTDIAGNKGQLSAPLNLRIITVAGDYLGTGVAQLALFDPRIEEYFVYGGASVVADPGSSYRDIPIQYDFNGDGITDFAAFRFDTSTYFGQVSPNSTINLAYGKGGVSLPVSDYYGNFFNVNPATGTFFSSGGFIYANYGADSGLWGLALPQPGGFVIQFGVPHVDIPAPGAYNGSGVDEIAFFRPTEVAPVTAAGGDADSFNVGGPNGEYQVSFTSAAVEKLGFVYKAGDIPAPADYLGLGYDQFAIYRPSTGQFFILNTPNTYNSSTWTLKTVTLNLPGGPNASDVPVSEDYDGNGKIDEAIYRPSTATFIILHSSTGIQQTVQWAGAVPNFHIAPAGPLLYRLTAVHGTNGGYPSVPVVTGSGGGTVNGIRAMSVQASASNSSTSSSTPVPSLIAVASPMVMTSATVPTTLVNTSSTTSSTSVTTSTLPVTVGAATPKTQVKTAPVSKSHEPVKKPVAHPKVEAPKAPVKKPVVEAKKPAVKPHTPVVAPKPKVQPKATETAAKKPLGTLAAVAALQHLVMAKKGKTKS
jgi:subtilisin-like proprotein convertase family protein